MKRILAISDIHGCYDEFKKLLELVDYKLSSDQLILVGDYVDRGMKSKDVLYKVIELVNNGAIALRGNHDEMFLDWLTSDDYISAVNFFRNGGFSTVTSYVGYNWFDEGYDEVLMGKAKQFILKNYSEHVSFLSNLPYYHETEHYIFVHAGINPYLRDWKYTENNDFIWIRDQFLHNDHNHKQTIIHGHTPATYLHKKHDIYFGNKKIGIDGACAYGGQLNCLEIKDGEFKQFQVSKMK
ncbi:metallophosphoesterase family protein [Bacillus sp. T33-2]|uniref:metallophosphoesterase family protein n=1 Tax=Bacillus sp. T33-2 TaxID=2054168 RepID=UPI000C77EF8F|nr:metallophosphoesterase family protein [Bacillus sp. T33-2]PLR99507.1 serine/threonine protein phosphatase [Bacillus sp. T33-2]